VMSPEEMIDSTTDRFSRREKGRRTKELEEGEDISKRKHLGATFGGRISARLALSVPKGKERLEEREYTEDKEKRCGTFCRQEENYLAP